MRRLFLTILFCFAFSTTGQSEVYDYQPLSEVKTAKKRLPIIFGTGNDITHLKDLSGKRKKYADKKLAKDLKVGYYFERFHVFFLNVWTWDGKFVVYNEQGFLDPTAAQWKRLLGKKGTATLAKPIWYKFPPGLLVLGVLVLGFVALMFFVGGDEEDEGMDAQDYASDDSYDQVA